LRERPSANVIPSDVVEFEESKEFISCYRDDMPSCWMTASVGEENDDDDDAFSQFD
jgi:hypothetical protein